MTTPTLDEAARRRTLRRRHLLQRQTIVFGTIIVALAVAGLAALGVYLGVVPPPFDQDFTDTSAETEVVDVVPCPAEGTLPVAWNQITANVYNGSSTTGLAGSIAATLQGAGVVTANVTNYPGGAYTGATLIVTGPNGIPSAYTLAALFPGATIQLEQSRDTLVVDVVAGSAYEPILPPAEHAPDPAVPLVGLEGCTPYTDLPRPSATAA